MFGHAEPDPKPPELQRAEDRSMRTVTDYVEDMIAAGLPEGDAEAIGRAYWAALHGLIVLRMAGRIGADEFEARRHQTMRLDYPGRAPHAKGQP